MHDVRTHHALVSPRVAELYLLINDTVGAVFLCELVDILAASGHFGGVHIARALTAVHVPAAYLRQRVLIIGQLNGIASGERAAAETVGTDISAGALDELYKAAVVHLGADHQHTGTIAFLVRLAGLELFESFFELVNDQVLRRNVGRKRNNVELIARDARLVALAEIADSTDELADAVVLCDGLTYRLIGNVNAIVLMQGLEDVVFALESVEVQAVVVGLHGYLHILKEELFLVLAQSLQQLHVLDGAVHHRAAVGSDEAVGKVVAALDSALKQGAAVLAEEAGHVIGRHFHGTGARCAQTRGKRARQVQQRLGCVLADVCHADLPLALRLQDKLILSFLQEIFKIEQVLEIFHIFSSPIAGSRQLPAQESSRRGRPSLF